MDQQKPQQSATSSGISIRREVDANALVNAEVALVAWERAAKGDITAATEALGEIMAAAEAAGPFISDQISEEILRPWPWLSAVASSAFETGNLHLVARVCAIAEQWHGPEGELMKAADFANPEMAVAVLFYAELLSTGVVALAPLDPDHMYMSPGRNLRVGNLTRPMARRLLDLHPRLQHQGKSVDQNVLAIVRQILS